MISLLWIFGVVALDRLTKVWALRDLVPQDTYPVIPGLFHLTLIRNQGIAFGLFHRYDGILLFFISISILLLLIFSWSYLAGRFSRALPWCLILGGALGNWIDRFFYGAVIDFLDFRVWPVFNFADTAISLGVLLCLIHLVRDANTGATKEMG